MLTQNKLRAYLLTDMHSKGPYFTSSLWLRQFKNVLENSAKVQRTHFVSLHKSTWITKDGQDNRKTNGHKALINQI